jgi:hypothetical protein
MPFKSNSTTATCGLPASTGEIGKRYPLQLDIQFFADPPENNNPEDPPADPPGGSDDDLTLADLLKTNPKIKAEVNDRIEKAIKKRFKDIDPSEAAAALEEKRQREEAGEDQTKIENEQIKKLSATNAQLLKVAQEAAVISYAAKEGLDPNLITRLAAHDVAKLQLDDSFKADPEDVGEIVENLRAEFPDLFTTEKQEDPKDKQQQRRGYAPGPNNQRTNTPPPPAPKGVEATKERVERLRKLGRI